MLYYLLLFLSGCALLFLLVVYLQQIPPSEKFVERIEKKIQQANKFYEQMDYTKAVPLYRKVAGKSGCAEAMYKLGLMYHEGQGIKQDYKQAAEWWGKAAKLGEAVARYNLGLLYEKGQGVKQNYDEATEWFRKAAEQGLADAQYNLGNMYREGKGVLEDYQKSVEWYHKAAEQGNATALNNLSFMYLNGHGVKKDLLTTYALFILAAKEGSKTARESANKMKKELTTEQIMAGQKIAREWEQRIEANRQKNR